MQFLLAVTFPPSSLKCHDKNSSSSFFLSFHFVWYVSSQYDISARSLCWILEGAINRVWGLKGASILFVGNVTSSQTLIS